MIRYFLLIIITSLPFVSCKIILVSLSDLLVFHVISTSTRSLLLNGLLASSSSRISSPNSSLFLLLSIKFPISTSIPDPSSLTQPSHSHSPLPSMIPLYSLSVYPTFSRFHPFSPVSSTPQNSHQPSDLQHHLSVDAVSESKTNYCF